MPTATLQRDDGAYRPRFRRTPEGYEATRFYRISNDADGEDDCLIATGLPLQGDPWSPTAPGNGVFARDFDVITEGGDWYYVKVDYRSNRGGDITPVDGLVNTTVLRGSNTSETVFYDVTGTARLGEDGTQKILTTFDIMVDQYYADAAALVAALPALKTLSDEPKLNEFAIACPNLYGSGEPLLIDARQALYVNFETDQVGELFRVRHMLQWRRDWDWSGTELDDDMTPIASFTPQPVYEEADFVAVFDPPGP